MVQLVALYGQSVISFPILVWCVL